MEHFSVVWEERNLAERTEDLEETETMSPQSAPAEFDPGVDEAELLERLPEISYREVENRFAEVEIERTLGRGGMASVASANQAPLRRQVAVKRLRPDVERDGNLVALLHEAWITGKLEHPNIIPIYRLGRDEAGEPLIMMKQVGGAVWERLVEDPSRMPRLLEGEDPLDWHLDVLATVCNAVHYAHDRGIIHRDLKPGNVMIGEFGEVYVLDWGLAAAFEPERYEWIPALGDVEIPAGTPAYMPPEMIEGNRDEIGPRSDVYLLGGMLHFVLTGRPPNGGETAYEVMFDAYRNKDFEFPDDVDEQIARICTRALQPDAGDRYASADEFRQAILEYKRHRESLRLSSRAEERLETFRELVDTDREVEGAEIREVFGECRFGFEEALEASAANTGAREGLQETLELMIDYEIEREGHAAASMLLEDLPEPDPERRERVEQLGAQLEARERNLERLERLERESDTELARHARSIVAIILAVTWGVIGAWPGVNGRFWSVDPGWGVYLGATLVELGILGGVLYWGRRELLQNRANRQIVGGVILAFVTEGVIRYVSWRGGLSVGLVKSQQMLITFLVLSALGLGIDRRLFWAAGPFAVGGLLGTNFQEFIHLINGAANFAGLGLLAWAWWPEQQSGSEADRES